MGSDLGGVTVLCVDGDADARQETARQLEAVREPLSVVTAGAAREALDRLEEEPVDCVHSRYALPEMDGIEFLESVRDDDPVVPFVLSVADGDEGIASRAIDAGVTDYVARDGDPGPAHYERLADRIERAVERARAERERREKSSQLDAIFENLPVSLYFKDEQARHRRVSEAHARGYGNTGPPRGKTGVTLEGPEDFVGKTDLDLFAADNAREAYEDDLRVIETGDPIKDKEEHISVPDGEDRWVTTTKVPWRDEDGRIQGVFGFTLDITERKRRERTLERQNERLDQFASVVSHDLRNPLSVASGHLELLRADRTDDEHVEAIGRALERMKTMIDDLLAMARAGGTVEETDPVSLSVIAWTAWENASTADCELEVCPPTDVEIVADRDRLLHVFENLFRNARDHNDPPVRIRVDTIPGRDDREGSGDREGRDSSSDLDGFVVEDDAGGIPPDERAAVFEHGYTTSTDGTGVGLSIVQDIVNAHGWAVRVVEGIDGGARFEITGVETPDRGG